MYYSTCLVYISDGKSLIYIYFFIKKLYIIPNSSPLTTYFNTNLLAAGAADVKLNAAYGDELVSN